MICLVDYIKSLLKHLFFGRSFNDVTHTSSLYVNYPFTSSKFELFPSNPLSFQLFTSFSVFISFYLHLHPILSSAAHFPLQDYILSLSIYTAFQRVCVCVRVRERERLIKRQSEHLLPFILLILTTMFLSHSHSHSLSLSLSLSPFFFASDSHSVKRGKSRVPTICFFASLGRKTFDYSQNR